MPARTQVDFVVNIEDLALVCSPSLGVESRLRCGVSRRHEAGVTSCGTICPVPSGDWVLLGYAGGRNRSGQPGTHNLCAVLATSRHQRGWKTRPSKSARS